MNELRAEAHALQASGQSSGARARSLGLRWTLMH
jgi:hypothetical protein